MKKRSTKHTGTKKEGRGSFEPRSPGYDIYCFLPQAALNGMLFDLNLTCSLCSRFLHLRQRYSKHTIIDFSLDGLFLNVFRKEQSLLKLAVSKLATQIMTLLVFIFLFGVSLHVNV